jgi:hypothetical protein
MYISIKKTEIYRIYLNVLITRIKSKVIIILNCFYIYENITALIKLKLNKSIFANTNLDMIDFKKHCQI